MIPNIFVSSTIQDLHHLRDALRDVIRDSEYAPIMSEYGEIGYLPSTSAEESCYLAMAQCQIAVLIIGKRYGTLCSNGISITHNEFKAARRHNIPVITLVNEEVMAFRSVYEANPETDKPSVFPGMDNPIATFDLIQEIASSTINNGILNYRTTTEARAHLKRQLAHLFGDLLRRSESGIVPDIKQILAEITTLRHEFGRSIDQDLRPFLSAVKHLYSQKFQLIRTLTDNMFADSADAVPIIMESDSFSDFITNSGCNLIISRKRMPDFGSNSGYLHLSHSVLSYAPTLETGKWGIKTNHDIEMEKQTKIAFDREYLIMKNEIKASLSNYSE